MILALEIAMFLIGLFALIRGKLTLTKERTVEGTAARLIGLIGLVPLPLAFAVGFGIGAYLAAQGRQMDQSMTVTLGFVEAGITLGTLALMSVLTVAYGKVNAAPERAVSRRRRDDDYDDLEDEDRPAKRRRRREEEEEEVQDAEPVSAAGDTEPTGITAKPPTPRGGRKKTSDNSDEPEPRPRPARASRKTESTSALSWVLAGVCVMVVLGCMLVGGAVFAIYHFRLNQPAPVAQKPPFVDRPFVENKPPVFEEKKGAFDEKKGPGIKPDWPPFENKDEKKPDWPPFEKKEEKKPEPPPVVRIPLPAANVSPLKIAAAPKTFDKATLKLPGTVSRVCVGGGGRFLILAIPSQRQIAVLDVSERKITKYLPMAGDQAIIAAGLEKLVVAYPAQSTIQRWNLLTFEKELTVNSPFEHQIRALCMGHASFGPLLVAFKGDGFANGMQFLSLDSLKVLNVPKFGAGDGHFLHASANGRYFGFRNGVGGEPHTVTLLNLTEESAKPNQVWNIGASILAPSPDGRFVYSSSGVFNTDLKKVHAPAANKPYLPAAHGSYFLRLEPHDGDQFGKAPRAGKIAFYLAGNFTPLAYLDNIEGVTSERISYGSNAETLMHSERVHFVPNAKLVLSIPPTNDRVELCRFDPEEAMDKAGIDYLLVTSDPPAFAERGKRFSYPLVVKSKKGGVKVKLDSGPDGMKLTGERELVWDVPSDWNDRNPNIIVTVSDASGQELFHNFTLAVVDKLPDNARPVREDPKNDPEPKTANEPPAKIKPSVPDPLGIVAPKLTEKVVLDVPGYVSKVVPGGGGRFLLFSMPEKRTIALFDVNHAKIVHQFAMESNDYQVTAGMSKMVVSYPGTKTLQRWDLLSRQMEESVAWPVNHSVEIVLMGSATEGPVFVGAGGYSSKGKSGATFLDLNTFKTLDLKRKPVEGSPHGFVTDSSRISGDGTVIATWEPRLSPNGPTSHVISQGQFETYYEHRPVQYMLPSPDGKYIYTEKGVLTNQLKPVGNLKNATAPAIQGEYYLSVTPGKSVDIVKAGDTKSLMNIKDTLAGTTFRVADLCFIADAKMVVLAKSGKIHVIPIDLESAMDKQGIDYLYTASRPPRAVQGEPFQYVIQVRSKRGDVQCKLAAGPDGMKVSRAGVVTWNVPADSAEVHNVIVTIQDASGQEIFHNFRLTAIPSKTE